MRYVQICDLLDAAAVKKGKLTGDALRPKIERIRVSSQACVLFVWAALVARRQADQNRLPEFVSIASQQAGQVAFGFSFGFVSPDVAAWAYDS